MQSINGQDLSSTRFTNGGERWAPLLLLTTTISLAAFACVPAKGERNSTQVLDPNEQPANTDSTPTPSDSPGQSSGADYWQAQCAGCHGDFSSGSAISSGNRNGDFRLDAEAAIREHGNNLELYIERSMPSTNASDCVGVCAQVTGAYIRSRQTPVISSANCENESIAYGLREMKLLSSSEYQRSLQTLLGVTANYGALVANTDNLRGGFLNMHGVGVSSATLESYMRNAEDIAAWAVASGRPFACAGGTACASRFVDEFLFRAFRGPVSEEQRQQYTDLFQNFPEDGMRLALEAALSSPYFLYRVEAGVDLQTALARGYYTSSGGEPRQTSETISAPAFPSGSGSLEDGVWVFTENGGTTLFFSTPFDSRTTIEVLAQGTNHNGVWPELTVRVGNTWVETQTVGSNTLATYRFLVEGQSGSLPVRIEFNNDSGVPPYGPGQDINLHVASVGISVEGSAPAEAEPPASAPPLSGVATDAFVLTPYEFASALSFMLTGSTPDDTLLAAAQNDQLTTPTQIRTQVVRLIDSEQGQQHFGDFVIQWFGLDEVKRASRPAVPEFTPEVKAAMLQEVREHFAHVFYNEDVPFSALFNSSYTFLNRTLAEFYGIGGNFGDDFVQTEVSGRGGPIASGAFMAANAHVERTAPILRAVHSRETALCHTIDPPNAPIAGEDIDAQRALAQMQVSEREASEGALSSRDFYFLYTDGIEACAGCHEKIINPMFGMEDFDNVGRLRPKSSETTVWETIQGVQKEVSLEGSLIGVDSPSDPNTLNYAGAKDFSNQIAETETIKSCLVRRGFRYLTGLTFNDRDLDTGSQELLTPEQRETYSCVAARMRDTLVANDESPRSMFIELAMESLLRLRR